MIINKSNILTLLFATIALVSVAQSRIYVNQNATGSTNGTSWTNAYTSIDSAFANSVSDDTIWISAGRYFPTGNGVNARFDLPNGRVIYGSFAGIETNIDQRDITNNITYLDGDIGTQGSASDNCRNVVFANNLTSPVLVDGFHIVNGYAYTVGGSITVGGGGARILNSYVHFSNCTFEDNYTYMRGGAIYAQNSSGVVLKNCVFKNNITGNNTQSLGGAIYMNSGYLTVESCTFTSNQSKSGGAIATYSPTVIIDRTTFSSNKATTDDGGAIYNGSESTLSVYNSLFAGNYSEGNCAAIYTSSTLNTNSQKYVNCTFADNYTKQSNGYTAYASDYTTVSNCIFWGNVANKPLFNLPPAIEPNVNNCLIEGGISYGNNNIDKNPLFVKAGDAQNAPFAADTFDYSLQITSPALNSGSNSYVNSNYNLDIWGNARIQGNSADLGAFESPYTTFKITTSSNDPAADETSGGGQYLKDSTARISTKAKNDCYTFLYWKENDKVVSYDTSFTISVTANRNFTSHYSQLEFAHPARPYPVEWGTVIGAGSYPCSYDSLRTFIARPSGCYQFVNWTIDAVIVSTDSIYTTLLTKSSRLIANFEPKQLKVQLLASPPAGGTVSGGGTFTCDTFIQLTATPNSGYKFVGWKENGVTAYNFANYPLVVKKDANLVAEFISNAGISNQLQNQIALYPNPTSGILHIKTDVSIDAITITDITGKEILKLAKQSILQNSNSIDISHLSVGIYIVKITSNSAKTHFNLVKE